MKKLIALTTVALTLSIQGIALSSSDYKMDDDEFADFVCAYIEAMGREEGIEAVKAEAMSSFTEQQIATLDKVQKSNKAAANLCK